jgi:hypothetical protein
VVVQDDSKAFGCQRLDDLVVDLKRSETPELGIGSNPCIVDDGGVMDHLVREGQPDRVDASRVELSDYYVNGNVLKTQRHSVCVLARMVVCIIVDVAITVVCAAGSVPITALQFESVSRSVDDVTALSVERRCSRVFILLRTTRG